MKILIAELLVKHNFNDYFFISPEDIAVSQRVRIKCQYSCNNYFQKSCPPNTPSISECKDFFNEYSNAVIIKLKCKRQNSKNETIINSEINNQGLNCDYIFNNELINLEKDLINNGFPFAFVFYPFISKDNINTQNANNRPTPTAFAVDMFRTLKLNNITLEPINPKLKHFYMYTILLID